MVSYVILLVIAVLAYLVLMQGVLFFTHKKRKRFFKLLRQRREVELSPLAQWLDKKGLRSFLSLSLIRREAQKHGVHVSNQSFLLTFFMGALVSVLIMWVYFRPLIILMPSMIVLGGYMGMHLRLHGIKKKYIQQKDDKVTMYMSALATAMGTFGNSKQSFASVIPMLESPVKQDVEYAFIRLQDGKSVKHAFADMNHKYQGNYLRLFHDQLDVLVKGGSGDVTFLRKIAWKMKQKAVYRRKLQTAHRQNFKVWRAFVILSLSAPFLFIFVSFDHYKLVMNHMASSIVFAITFAMIGLTYRQLEKLELYDPTDNEAGV